jgi:acetolactate synthase-1/3 small subunit
MKKTLTVTVQNESGILTRICTVFSSRGLNIESLTVAPTQDPTLSKLILVLPGDVQLLEQITKQLNRLVQVTEVKEISHLPCVERELLLLKVSLNYQPRSYFLELVQIFKGKVVDLCQDSMTLEVSGDPTDIEKFFSLIQREGILEMVRSGKIAMKRSDS